MKKAEETKQIILDKAYELIYSNGYNATSIDDIIHASRLTKGAFYYHFKNKEEMALAMLNDVLFPYLEETMVQPLNNALSPADDLYGMLSYLLLDDPYFEPAFGCPLGNLIQELAPTSGSLNSALLTMTNAWEEAIVKCVNHGKKTGLLKAETKAKQVAYFIMSGYWGARLLGKIHASDAPYKVYLKEVKQYLQSI